MRSDISESLASRGVKGDFKFSNIESFRLFVEGLQELRSFERSPAAETLAAAEEKLDACVHKYPQDVLPQFYLGIAKVFRSYAGVDDAIRLFRDIVGQNIPALRPAARYNLAVAYIERYDDESLRMAQNSLNTCIDEIGRPKSAERRALQLEAKVLLLFCGIREIFPKRIIEIPTVPAPYLERLEQLEHDLDRLFEQVMRVRIPDAAKTDVLADYWNNKGLIEELRAAAKPNERSIFANTAIKSYREALKSKANWIPPLSNQARVYQDILGNFKEALRLWDQVEQIRPGDEYKEYMVGRICYSQQNYEEAAQHFKNASDILSAKEELAEMYFERLHRYREAAGIWHEILLKHPNHAAAKAGLVKVDPLLPH